MENTLSEQEKQYIEYWEKNRDREKKVLNQLLIGMPLGIIFASPVLLNLFGRWHTRADMEAHTKLNPAVLLIAMLCIIAFVAIFSRRHKWEMKEQQYRSFIAKRDSLGAGPQENKDENQHPPAANHED
jgi:hypothetical protein